MKIGPDLVISAVNGSTVAAAGGTVSVTETTKNQGGGNASASTTRYFLSTNATLDASDTPLGSRPVPPLASGATSSQTSTLTLPPGLATGSYYIVVEADADAVVPESAETNNVSYMTVRVGPDLVVSALSVAGTPTPGSAITVTDTTKNQGVGDAPASTTSYYLSTTVMLDASDLLLGREASAR